MRVGVDARHLTAGRGVARYTRALLGALAAAHPEDDWLAFVPGREPVRAVPAGVRLVRHALPGRALFGAAAVTGRPRLDDLLGGAIDVVWVPAPAPLAVSPGVPLVLTVHDRSFEERPATSPATSACGTGSPAPARSPAAPPRSSATRARAATTSPAHGASRRRSSPPGADRPHRARAGPRGGRGAPYLLFVGALEPRKAPDVLADAYARARARGLGRARRPRRWTDADRRHRRPARRRRGRRASSPRCTRARWRVVAPSLAGGLRPAAGRGGGARHAERRDDLAGVRRDARRRRAARPAGRRAASRTRWCASSATPRCGPSSARRRSRPPPLRLGTLGRGDARRARRGRPHGELHRACRHPRLRAELAALLPSIERHLDRRPPGRGRRQRLARRRRRDRPRPRRARRRASTAIPASARRTMPASRSPSTR